MNNHPLPTYFYCMLVTTDFYNLGFIHLSALPARKSFLHSPSHHSLNSNNTDLSPLDVSNQRPLKVYPDLEQNCRVHRRTMAR